MITPDAEIKNVRSFVTIHLNVIGQTIIYLHQDDIFNTYERFGRTISDKQTIKRLPMNRTGTRIQQVAHIEAHTLLINALSSLKLGHLLEKCYTIDDRLCTRIATQNSMEFSLWKR